MAGAGGAVARQAQRRLRPSDFLGFEPPKKRVVLRTASWRFLGIPYELFRSPFFTLFFSAPGTGFIYIMLLVQTQIQPQVNAKSACNIILLKIVLTLKNALLQKL